MGKEEISPMLVPARNKNFENLAPAYIEAGELDILRDECVRYASELWKAGVSAELHVRAGVPRGFDSLLQDAPVIRQAFADRIRVLKDLETVRRKTNERKSNQSGYSGNMGTSPETEILRPGESRRGSCDQYQTGI